ncbi:putative synaptobrevin [Danaus plexippus plexippus]|uniref:Synaptobrevin n=1 Tax=Danaus plexippus plexippus TaxID=278856 RepID=A0A212EZG6_DANPL|nr:putative synaptobrevin [Danaus plexippus plexippus]
MLAWRPCAADMASCQTGIEKRAALEGGTPGGLAPAEPQTGPDGEIIGGPRTPQQIAAQRRLQQTQAQVDEVVDIMKSNVEKVLDRDAKLSELDDRADALQQGASQFEQQAKSLKNKFWLQNLKMMIIMGVIGIVIIGLLFGEYTKIVTMKLDVTYDCLDVSWPLVPVIFVKIVF